mgnify:CR=1 FL=1
MKPHEAALRVGIKDNTVRLWTSNEFKEFFSPTGQAREGRERDLSDTDLSILWFIQQSKRAGQTKDEIIASLRAADEVGIDLLPLPPLTPPQSPTEMIPRQAAEAAVFGERRVIEILDRQISDLNQRLDAYEANRVKSEAEFAELNRQLREAVAEKAAALRTVELYDSGRLSPPGRVV